MKKLTTKRLYITPLNDNQLKDRIAEQADNVHLEDWQQRLDICVEQPKERKWYTIWDISLRDGSPVGSIYFSGPPELGTVELYCSIGSARRGQGFASEAMTSVINWVFEQEDIYFVSVDSSPDNPAWEKVLDRLGFAPLEDGRRIKEKSPSSWMSIYMMLGMSVGLSLGVALGKLAMGLPVGMCLGMLVGIHLDDLDKKKRAKLRAKQEEVRKIQE